MGICRCGGVVSASSAGWALYKAAVGEPCREVR